MDLNYLLYRHQVSLMRASVAACGPSRRAHEGLVGLYADAIARLGDDAGCFAGLSRSASGDFA